MKYTLITNIYNVAERMLHLLKQTWLESTQEKTTRVVNNIGTSLKAHTFCRKEMVTLKQKILSILFDSSMCIQSSQYSNRNNYNKRKLLS